MKIIDVEFDDDDQAAYAAMFLDRCGFDHFFDRTEPHLSKDERTERAYRMRDAIVKIERALEAAGVAKRIY